MTGRTPEAVFRSTFDTINYTMLNGLQKVPLDIVQQAIGELTNLPDEQTALRVSMHAWQEFCNFYTHRDNRIDPVNISSVHPILGLIFWKSGVNGNPQDPSLLVRKLNVLKQGDSAPADAMADIGAIFAPGISGRWRPTTKRTPDLLLGLRRTAYGIGAALGVALVMQPSIAAAAEVSETRTAMPANTNEFFSPVVPEASPTAAELDANKLSDTRYKEKMKSIIGTLNGSPELVEMYKTIEKETGLDWRIVAAFHYREHSLSLENPKNGQGIFQNTAGGFPASGYADKDEMVKQGKYMVAFLKGKVKDILPNGDVSYLNPSDPKFDPALLWRAAARYNGLPKFYQDQADTVFGKDAPGYLGTPYVVGMMYDQTDSSINKNFLQYTVDTSSKKVLATSQLGFMPLVISLFEASGTKLDGIYGGKPIYIRLPGGSATTPSIPNVPQAPITTPEAQVAQTPIVPDTPLVVDPPRSVTVDPTNPAVSTTADSAKPDSATIDPSTSDAARQQL